MPKLTIEGGESVDVAENKRLVRVLVEGAGVDQCMPVEERDVARHVKWKWLKASRTR